MAKVVLPDDSGPKISMILPLGNPPTPRAKSIVTDPVEITSIGSIAVSPKRITVPFPKDLSNLSMVICKAFNFSAFAEFVSFTSLAAMFLLFSLFISF